MFEVLGEALRGRRRCRLVAYRGEIAKRRLSQTRNLLSRVISKFSWHARSSTVGGDSFCHFRKLVLAHGPLQFGCNGPPLCCCPFPLRVENEKLLARVQTPFVTQRSTQEPQFALHLGRQKGARGGFSKITIWLHLLEVARSWSVGGWMIEGWRAKGGCSEELIA